MFGFISSSVDGRRFISHFDASVFVSRRHEMCNVANDTLFYLLSRPVVHAETSALPFLVSSLFFKSWCWSRIEGSLYDWEYVCI